MGPVQRVLCNLATFVKERSGMPVTSDDSFSMLIEFESGARSALQMSIASGVTDARLALHGSEGQLIIPNLFATELHGGKRSDRKISPMDIPERFRLPREDQQLRPPFRALVSRMIQAIDNRLPSPAPNFIDGMNSQAVLDAARLSSKDGRWVEVSKA
jgi:predicted dehydrogenase